MKRSDILRLVGRAAAVFPNHHNKDTAVMAEVWWELLGHLPFEVAMAALLTVMSRSEFFPTPAAILHVVQTIQPRDSVPTPEQAWEEVLKQVHLHGSYNPDRVVWTHPVVEKAAHALHGSWLSLCKNLPDGKEAGVDRAHFFRLYETYSKREREFNAIPDAARKLIEAARNPLLELDREG